MDSSLLVTPCVGVWIETSKIRIGAELDIVTPCVGVWIETQTCLAVICYHRSHPAWVCGLKPVESTNHLSRKESHPAWVCGLKLPILSAPLTSALTVTPCVGVWIETLNSIDVRSSTLVTPCVGVWIETSILLMFVILLSHTLRGCVD